MALAKNLEDLLKLMSADDAKAQREIWEKSPEIAKQVDSFFVPQSEFSRQLNAKDARIKAAEDDAAKIREWEKTARPINDRVNAENERLTKELNAANERLAVRAAAVASGDGTVDADKLLETVLKQVEGRTVSQEKMTELLKAEADRMSKQITDTMEAEKTKFFTETVPRGLAWQSEMLEVQQDYRELIGKKMDKAEFSKFMTDHQITNPREAFEKFTAATIREKEIKAEVEKRVQDELNKRTIPGVTPGETYTGDRGVMQLKIAGELPAPPEGSKLGDKVAANAAAKELRAEGLF